MSAWERFFPELPASESVQMASSRNRSDNKLLRAAGVRDVGIRARVDSLLCNGIIKNVLHVPQLGANLFSAGAAADNG